MDNGMDFIETKDLDNIKRALENAELDYDDEITPTDGNSYIIETISVRFKFDSDGNMTNVEPLDANNE